MPASNRPEKFWEFVDFVPFHPCWEWARCRDRRGYGRFSMLGRQDRAHRFAWVITRGPIPDGAYVLHKCDNPPCVRPSHLYLGDHAQNTADFVARRRWKTTPGTLASAERRASRSACKSGHVYPENAKRKANGSRICRECCRIRHRAYVARRRLSAARCEEGGE